MKISIEYCNSWNYLPRASRMAADLLDKYGNSITNFSLIPSSGGVYEVMKNDQVIFSKKQLNRFPELEELINIIES